jgi:hypothetical protein
MLQELKRLDLTPREQDYDEPEAFRCEMASRWVILSHSMGEKGRFEPSLLQ